MRNFVKSMLLAVLFVVGVSCEKQFEKAVEVQVEDHATAEAVTSYEVSYEEALAKADALFAGIDGATTRAGSRRVKNHELLCSGKRFTRTASDDTEAKFYIINYEDNAGFVMVAADKRATDIYAYSDAGNLDVNDAIENSGFGVFMDGAVALYEDEVNTNALGLKDSIPFMPRPGVDDCDKPPFLPTEVVSGVTYYVKYGEYEIVSSKEPMVSVQWNQCNPYNYFCPSCNDYAGTSYAGKCAAGCGPVAAAQIMSYHKYPASYAGYEFDWDNMEPTFNMWDANPNENALMVAHLIREIGRTANASYGAGTSTNIDNIKRTFSKFGYNVAKDDYDVNKVKSSLDNNRPVYARGQTKSGEGHAWAIDGYVSQKKSDILYDSFAPYCVAITRTIVKDYVHCNWGWGGSGTTNSAYAVNGYCLSGAFVVFVNGENNEYTNNNKILYNISPKQ